MAKMPKEMPKSKKEELMPEELDPIFGDEMNLADDVAEGNDLDSALDAERMDQEAEGEVSADAEDEELIAQFNELLKRKPEALEMVQAEGDEESPEAPIEGEDDLLGNY